MKENMFENFQKAMVSYEEALKVYNTERVPS